MRSLAALLSLGLLACPPPPAQLVFEVPPQPAAQHATLDLGARGASATGLAFLKNVSSAAVPIAEPVFEGEVSADGSAFVVSGLAATSLEPSASVPVEVRFAPSGEHAGVVRVLSPSQVELASLTLAGRLDAAQCALPDVVDFGAVLPGEVVRREVAFPVLDKRREVRVGRPEAPFQLEAGAPAGTVDAFAGQQLTARVTLPSLPVGEYAGVWPLSAGGDCPEKSVRLVATVVADFLGASPAALDFGVFATPAQPTATLTLLNRLSRPVDVTLALASAGNVFTAPFTAATLPASTRDALDALRPGELELPLSALVLAPGPVTGTLTVTAPTTSLAVALVARGGGAGVVVLPAPLHLGDVPQVGATRLPLSSGLTVLNDNQSAGASTVRVTGVTVEAAPGSDASALCVGSFDVGQGRCDAVQPFDLAPGKRGWLSLRAAPTGPGPWKWFVVVATNDAQQPEVRVEVTAGLRAMDDCVLQAPGTLRVGPVRAPTPMRHALVFENQSPTACVVQGLWVDGSGDVRVTPSSFTLAGGERRLLEVEVLPTSAPGTVERPVLRYSVNAVTGPARAVLLDLRSDDGCLVLSPEQWDFGVSAPGCGPRTRAFAVGSRCPGEDLTVAATRVVGSAFALDGTPPERVGATSLTADALRVKFAPAGGGPQVGAVELDVVTDAGVRTWVVPLRGVGDGAGRQRDRFVVPGAADVLLVQDATSAMGPVHAGLAQRAGDLVAVASARNVQARVGSIASDETATVGQLRDAQGKRWVDLDGASEAQLRALVDVGDTSGNDSERFAGPAVTALRGGVATGVNAGFVRRGASLGVVSLTNAPDQSALPLPLLRAELLAVKGTQRPELLSWSSVGALAATAPGGCTYDGVTPAGHWAAWSSGLGGVVVEVCEARTDPAVMVTRVVPAALGARDTFGLRASIAPLTLPTVFVNGQSVPELAANGARNWSWDVTRAAVTLSSFSSRAGDVIELEYSTWCPAP